LIPTEKNQSRQDFKIQWRRLSNVSGQASIKAWIWRFTQLLQGSWLWPTNTQI